MKASYSNDLKTVRNLACEYRYLIEHLECNEDNHQTWVMQMSQLLPRLHSAIVLLESSPEAMVSCFPHLCDKDDNHCEIFMKINEFLLSDPILWPDMDRYDLKLSMCENLAYDFTDMYSYLKQGLTLLDEHPKQPAYAINYWRSSFFYHWGQKLVDAQGWLYAIGIGNKHEPQTGAHKQAFKMA